MFMLLSMQLRQCTPALCCTGLTISGLQAQPRIHLPDTKAKALMERIQNAGTEVVEAKVCVMNTLSWSGIAIPTFPLVCCMSSCFGFTCCVSHRQAFIAELGCSIHCALQTIRCSACLECRLAKDQQRFLWRTQLPNLLSPA